ncbi:MAG: DUF370 domain-containing protein [Clostridiales bacterium]|nr:DUF370 domain-containing protein [Clostridiales bacterium]
MLIHIGNEYLVRARDVIGIFDLDGDITPQITTEFLKASQKNGRCESAVLDLPRSFVLTEKDGKEKVILSHLSSSALGERSSSLMKNFSPHSNVREENSSFFKKKEAKKF